MTAFRIALHCVALCFVVAGTARASELISMDALQPPEHAAISVEIDGASYSLDGIMLRPKGDGPFPLAVINHGTCGSSCRARMDPARFSAQAEAFARRGYAAFVLIRRGYGASDGPYSESHGGCGTQGFAGAARGTAADIRAAIRTLIALPYVVGTRVLAVGQSGGGIGVAALAADPVPALKAAINFSGGRGGECAERSRLDDAKLTATFRDFGARSRLPALWIYVENDTKFGNARSPLAWHKAFADAGGRAEMAFLPPFGDDGHALFRQSSAIPIWAPIVDRFLKESGLPSGR
jgi:dienelactone hydrolase